MEFRALAVTLMLYGSILKVDAPNSCARNEFQNEFNVMDHLHNDKLQKYE